jgi:hypothetical protein
MSFSSLAAFVIIVAFFSIFVSLLSPMAALLQHHSPVALSDLSVPHAKRRPRLLGIAFRASNQTAPWAKTGGIQTPAPKTCPLASVHLSAGAQPKATSPLSRGRH